MKIWLRLVYADGVVAATLLRPWRWSYAFVALLYPFYIESEIPIRIYYDLGASTALLLRFYCALAVSAPIRVILTKISNRSGITVQWNGGGGTIRVMLAKIQIVAESPSSGIGVLCITLLTGCYYIELIIWQYPFYTLYQDETTISARGPNTEPPHTVILWA